MQVDELNLTDLEIRQLRNAFYDAKCVEHALCKLKDDLLSMAANDIFDGMSKEDILGIAADDTFDDMLEKETESAVDGLLEILGRPSEDGMEMTDKEITTEAEDYALGVVSYTIADMLEVVTRMNALAKTKQNKRLTSMIVAANRKQETVDVGY